MPRLAKSPSGITKFLTGAGFDRHEWSSTSQSKAGFHVSKPTMTRPETRAATAVVCYRGGWNRNTGETITRYHDSLVEAGYNVVRASILGTPEPEGTHLFILPEEPA